MINFLDYIISSVCNFLKILFLGYYPHHQLSYSMNSQQVNSTQPSAPVAQPTKKRLAIIDPSTGKDILQEGLNEETLPTKEEVSFL